MRLARRILTVMLSGLLLAVLSQAGDFRLVRSQSGPSGKVVGTQFVFDDTRSRFVYPQDKALIVYFDWDADPGTHVLTALWKRPDGVVDSISPEVKVETANRALACYWNYILYPDMPAGVWTLEVRIDGQPSGSHSFEIAGTGAAKRNDSAPAPPKPPSLDDVFRATSPSLVWVRKFDGSGKRTDMASGFVIGKNRVLTALQAIDGGSKLEIEFTGGRTIETDQIVTLSHGGDWAVIAVDTSDRAALPFSGGAQTAVGERLIVFNVEGGARVIGGVDVSGRRNVPDYGPRIQISPPLAAESAGGPLLDVDGKVVGVVGGSIMPGTRFDSRHMSVNPLLGNSIRAVNAATPLATVGTLAEKSSSLKELEAGGKVTAPLFETDDLIYVQTALEMPKAGGNALPRDTGEYSRRDKQVWVISEWEKKGKASKGMLSAKVYDDQNRVRVSVDPKKVSLYSVPTRSGFGFSPASLDPGLYRIDLIWDEKAVWQTFIRITD